jgi:maltose-binding protein MalE
MRLFHLAFFFACSLVWIGCTSKTSQTDNTSASLTIWYLNNTTGLETAIIHAASELSESNLNVSYKACSTLELQLLARGRSLANRPDVIIIPAEYLAKLASSNVLKRTSSKNHEDISPAVQSCIWQGASWATPLACDTRMLFINRYLFRTDFSTSSPIFLKNVWSSSSAFTGSTGHFWAAHSDDPETMYRSILSWMNMYGASVFDQNKNPALTSPQSVRALESFAEIAREGTTETERYLDAALQHGSIGLWYGRASLIRDSHQQIRNGRLMRQLHQEDHAAGPAVVFTTVACVTRNSTNASLAESFIRAVKQNIEVSSVAGFPTTIAYWNSSSNDDSYDMTLTSKSILQGRSIPSHPQWDEICPILEQAYTRVILGHAEPVQSLQQAQHELLQLQDS